MPKVVTKTDSSSSSSSEIQSSGSEISVLKLFTEPSLLPRRCSSKKLLKPVKSCLPDKRAKRKSRKSLSKIPSAITVDQKRLSAIPVISVKKDEQDNLIVACDQIRKIDKIATNFRRKRSVSQMEFKTSSSSSYAKSSLSSVALCPISSKSGGSSSIGRSIAVSEDFYYMMHDADHLEPDSKVAGMRIFASIMLNAWRRRRQDVKHLTEEMCRLKKGAVKVKNQIHVLNSLYKIEQKQNEELKSRVKRLTDDNSKLRKKSEALESSTAEYKGDVTVLDQQLHAKDNEIEGLNSILTETKSELFKAMSRVREVETLLSCERRNLLELENSKNDMITEILKLRTDGDDREILYIGKIDKMEAEISKLKRDIENLEKVLLKLKEKEKLIAQFESREKSQKLQIEELLKENEKLKDDLNSTIPNRIKTIFNDTILPSGMTTLRFMHLLAYLLLPATPPPSRSIPITFGLKRTVNVRM